jgi:EAL domain-containing protein (putative c-di-GMP-specific phosphodiesterase class I)
VTGVGTQDQLGALHAMGFPMAQGAALGTPAPAGAVPALLNAPLPAPFAASPDAPAGAHAPAQRL